MRKPGRAVTREGEKAIKAIKAVRAGGARAGGREATGKGVSRNDTTAQR